MSDEKLVELAWKAVHNTPGEVSVSDWGGDVGVNCYSFAANCKKPGKPKPDPGDKSKYSPKNDKGKFDTARLVAGAVRDGMVDRGTSQSDPPAPSDGHYLVALYLSSSDHHWYRKEPNTGRWLHKPGAHNIKNYGPGFKILPTELIMISHNYGLEATNYKFVRFLEVPVDGISVG